MRPSGPDNSKKPKQEVEPAHEEPKVLPPGSAASSQVPPLEPPKAMASSALAEAFLASMEPEAPTEVPPLSAPHISPFEAVRMVNEYGQEFWSSRDMAKLLGYREYRNFEPVLKKAKEACNNSGHSDSDHFVDSHDMIPTGKGAHRQVEAVQLSRYACYLIIQNADPSKDIVAAGQTYFAVQTRRQELEDQADAQVIENQRRLMLRSEMRDHNVQLAEAAKNAGVVQSVDYAIFQNHGYQGLYGGLGAKEIHARKGLKRSQEILDHMGSAELAANLFRATQAEQKLRREGITGKENANRTHREVGAKVRQTIQELGGTMPEDLPTVESIKALEREERKTLKDLDEQDTDTP